MARMTRRWNAPEHKRAHHGRTFIERRRAARAAESRKRRAFGASEPQRDEALT